MTRIKTVFTDISTICHIFANQSQNEARTPSNNLSVWGKNIKSYSTYIGKHITNEDGTIKGTLLSDRSYSVTTSKQQRALWSACNHLNVIWCEHVEDYNGKENFKSWVWEAEHLAAKLGNARKPEKYLNELDALKNKVTKYAEFMGYEIPATLLSALNITDGTQYLQHKENKEALKAAELAAAQKAKEIAFKKELKEWLKGKTHRMYTHTGIDQLRVNKDGAVHTTQGVTIPRENAIKMYQGLKANAIKEGAIIQDVNSHTYTVSSLDKKEIVIGCHRFKISYLISFGSKL